MGQNTDRFNACIDALHDKHLRESPSEAENFLIRLNNYRKSFHPKYESLTEEAWCHGKTLSHMGYGILEVLTR